MTYELSKWDERYISLVREVSTWSKDPSTKVGAIVVSNTGTVIAQGYNGFPRGIADTDERLNTRSIKYNYMVHAEMNGIYNGAYNGVCLVDSTMYVYGLPVCHECAKAIIQVGINKVIAIPGFDTSDKWKKSGDISRELFLESGVKYFTTKDFKYII